MLLNRLMGATGTSGKEQEVRTLILKEMKNHVKDVKQDKFGNLIAHRQASGPTIMLISHMDEIGLMVKSINEKGYIRCSEIGVTEPFSLIGTRVSIPTSMGRIHGVITLTSISNDEDPASMPRVEDLIVDTGLTKRELLKLGVEIGSYIDIQKTVGFLGSKKFVCGKALDDRVGCYILIELAKRLKKYKPKCNVFFVFSVQEEMGLYGAKTSIYNIKPDFAVGVDVTASNDFNDEPTRQMGKGPTITVKDAEMLANPCIDNWLKVLAKRRNIPYQLEVSEAGTTDALDIAISKGGIPTTVVGVAIRNLHTPIGIAHVDDINNAINLLELLLRNPPIICLT